MKITSKLLKVLDIYIYIMCVFFKQKLDSGEKEFLA